MLSKSIAVTLNNYFSRTRLMSLIFLDRICVQIKKKNLDHAGHGSYPFVEFDGQQLNSFGGKV